MTEHRHVGPGPRSLFVPVAAGVLPALAVGFLVGSGSEQADWRQHGAAGLAFGGIFLAAFLSRGDTPRRIAGRVGAVGCALLAAAIGWRGLPGFQSVFVLAGLLAGTGYWFGRRRQRMILSEAAGVGVVSMLGFWALAQLLWWTTPGQVWDSGSNRLWFLGSIAVMLACLAGWERARAGTHLGRRFRAIDGLVLVLLATAVVRTTDLANSIVAAHHWSVYVGPAEMVREGRALLGQVPSQYGFLNILLLAWLPAANRFEALYWLQVGTVWLSGGVVYFVLRAWVAAWWWQLVAGLLAFAGVMVVCGDLSLLTGPMVYPSAGAVRFLWVHLLLGYLCWWHRTAPPHAPVGKALRIGRLLWLGGVVWSVESAFYVTAAWLPAASLLAMTPAGGQDSPFSRLRALAAGIGRALRGVGLCLAGAAVLVGLIYLLVYHRWPQWSAYAEYARAVSGPLLSVPMDSVGPGWALLLLQAALVAALFGVAGERRSLALVWAAWGAGWSVSTYFISRSHPNNLAAIAPVLLLVIGVFLEAVKEDRRGWARPWVWIVTVTWGGAMLWLVAANPAAVRRQLAGYEVKPRTEHLLPAEPGADELLAHCERLQPGVFSVIGLNAFAATTLELTRPHSHWLPLRSLPLYGPLPVARREYYLDAYHGHARAGWLLAPMDLEHNDPYLSWLFDYIAARYTATSYLRNGSWQAWYYVPRARPEPTLTPEQQDVSRWMQGSGAPRRFLWNFRGSADSRLLATSAQLNVREKGSGFIGVTAGTADLRVNLAANRVRVTMVLRRNEKTGDGALAADFAAYASPLDQPDVRYERWRGRLELPAGQPEITRVEEIDGSGQATLFTVSVPAEFAGRVSAGWYNPEVTHVSRDSAAPVWFFQGGAPEVALDDTALARLLPAGWRPAEAWMRKGWVRDDGIELSPGGEIWLKAVQPGTRIAGTGEAPVGANRGVGAEVYGLWYKGGRVHYYDPPTPEDIAHGRGTFQAWSAEPGGWLVIAADDDPARAPIVVRVTSATEGR